MDVIYVGQPSPAWKFRGTRLVIFLKFYVFTPFLISPTLDKKLSFPLWISSVNVIKSAGTADLVTFTEEILNGKLHFLCSANS